MSNPGVLLIYLGYKYHKDQVKKAYKDGLKKGKRRSSYRNNTNTYFLSEEHLRDIKLERQREQEELEKQREREEELKKQREQEEAAKQREQEEFDKLPFFQRLKRRLGFKDDREYQPLNSTE